MTAVTPVAGPTTGAATGITLATGEPMHPKKHEQQQRREAARRKRFVAMMARARRSYHPSALEVLSYELTSAHLAKGRVP